MNGIIGGKKVSLDHLSIGSRRSGSYDGEQVDYMFEGYQQDPDVVAWAAAAAEGDKYQLGCGLFLTCW